MPISKRLVHPDTTSHGVGPLDLDVAMARRHGWSEKAIERTVKAIGEMSRRESGLAHRNGIVPGCPCVCCDLSIPISALPDEYGAMARRIREKVKR